MLHQQNRRLKPSSSSSSSSLLNNNVIFSVLLCIGVVLLYLVVAQIRSTIDRAVATKFSSHHHQQQQQQQQQPQSHITSIPPPPPPLEALDAHTTAAYYLSHQAAASLSSISYHEYVEFCHARHTKPLNVDEFAILLHQQRRKHNIHANLRTLYTQLTQKQQPLVQAPNNNNNNNHNQVSILNHQLFEALQSMDAAALASKLADVDEHQVPFDQLPLYRVARFVHSKLVSDEESRYESLRTSSHNVREQAMVARRNTSQSLLPQQEIPAPPPPLDPSSLPVAVIAHKRTDALRQCLTSLLMVDGMSKDGGQVTVYQDGNLDDVAAVVRSFGSAVRLVQRVHTEADVQKTGAMRIADHYRYTLSHIFDACNGSDYVIVVEDDMIFAPDFLTFFARTAHLYEDDPSILCISSWNDNGRKGLVSDASRLYRSEFFIGLGWMVSRRIYKHELEPQWPSTHWDHWLREPSQRKGRECVYPEISRNYNIGVEGTHSDREMYDRYFRHMVLNRRSDVRLMNTMLLLEHHYEYDMIARLSRAVHLSSVSAIKQMNLSHTGATVALYYQSVGNDDVIWENDIAPFFGLWTSVPFIRGMHKGLVQFKYEGVHIMLVASHSPYSVYKSPKVTFLTRADFGKAFVNLSPDAMVVVADTFTSCDVMCKRNADRVCDVAQLAYLNNCDALKSQFKCENGCHTNVGGDQPAYVIDKKDSNYQRCLVNGGVLSCSGAHPVTQRLCACMTK